MKEGGFLWIGSTPSCNVFAWPAVDSIASYEIQCSEYFQISKGNELWSTVSSSNLHPCLSKESGLYLSLKWKQASGYPKSLPSL